MRTRYLPIIAATGILVLAGAQPLHAQTTCSEQLTGIEADVANMHDAKLKAKAEKLMAKAHANAEQKMEKRCLRNVNTIQKVLKKDRMEMSKPHDSM